MWWLCGADRALPVRVVDDQVRVRPDRDRALARIHPEQPRGPRRDDLDPALLADLARPRPRRRGAGRRDPRRPAGRWGSCGSRLGPAPSGRGSRTGSGRWRPPGGRSSSRPVQSSSQFGFCSRSGGEHTNFEPSNPLPRSSRLRNRYCGQVSAKAIDPRSRASRTAFSASTTDRWTMYTGTPAASARRITRLRRLALEHRVAGDAVVVGVGLALGDEVGGHDVDRRAVLRVHQDQAAVLAGPEHRAEDRGVVAVEHARVGGEQLEVRDALGDQLVHLGERVVVDVAHDHVEPVVDDRVALGLRVPRVEARRAGPGPSIGRRSRRLTWSRRTPRRASRSRTCPSRTCRRTAAPCGCGRRSRPGSRTCRSASMVSSAVTPCPARSAPSWAIVSPSTRTSAGQEPSAVTTVPFAIRVRIGPPRARGGAGHGRRGTLEASS